MNIGRISVASRPCGEHRAAPSGLRRSRTSSAVSDRLERKRPQRPVVVASEIRLFAWRTLGLPRTSHQAGERVACSSDRLGRELRSFSDAYAAANPSLQLGWDSVQPSSRLAFAFEAPRA